MAKGAKNRETKNDRRQIFFENESFLAKLKTNM